MQARKARKRSFQVEALDARIAPATLTVAPPAPSAAVPAATTVADAGCENGIEPHASEASSGVVTC